MANVEILAPFILSFEGGFSDHPSDSGGATNKGVTLSTWRAYGDDKTGDSAIDIEDLKLLSDSEVIHKILKPHYWDRCCGDDICDQSLANIIVDWVWMSGVWGIKHLQGVLGLSRDGIVGAKTLESINNSDPKALFSAIKLRREEHLRSIVESDPSQEVFLRGWLRRLESIRYDGLTKNGYA